MTARWAIEWRSENALDGERRFFMWNGTLPILFETRDEARTYVRERYGYIASRPDLAAEPHGWKMPRPVRVSVALLASPGEPPARAGDAR